MAQRKKHENLTRVFYLRVTEEMNAAIRDYRFTHRYEEVSDAIRHLLAIGLAVSHQEEAIQKNRDGEP